MKDCITCYLGEQYECPYMESTPNDRLFIDEECFAWVKDRADMRAREEACREYRKMMNKKQSMKHYYKKKGESNDK